VILPWYHERNGTLRDPDPYTSLDWDPSTDARRSYFGRVEYYSRGVSVESMADKMSGMTPDE